MRRRTVLTVAGGALAGGIGLAAASRLNDGGDEANAPDSWPQIGHDARHTRHAPAARGPRDDATIAWRRLGDRPVYPPVVDDALYLTEAWTDGGALSLGLEDGDERWSNDDLPPMRWAPALHDSRLFVLTRGPGNLVRLHALDPANGERLWVRDEGITASSAGAGHVPNGPTVRDGYVYVASNRGIVACDAATGDVEWTATFGPHVVEREGGPTSKTIWVKPAVTDDRAFTFDENDSYGETRKVYAVDRASGDPEWTAELELGDDWSLRGSVVAGADRVFVVASGGSCGRLESLGSDGSGDANDADSSDDANCSEPDRLFALDADSGDVDWERSRPEFVGPPAYADGTLYVADLDSDTGRLRALDATSGEATWTYENEDGGVALPAVTDDTVYVNQGSGLAAVNRANGERRWEIEVEADSSLGPPVIVGDTAYVTTNPGRGYDSRILAVREP